jgi:hypothetical protein
MADPIGHVSEGSLSPGRFLTTVGPLGVVRVGLGIRPCVRRLLVPSI